MILIEDLVRETDPWSDWRPERLRETTAADEDEGEELTATHPEEGREEEGRSEEGLTLETDSEKWRIEEEKGAAEQEGHEEERGMEEERKLVGGLDYREKKIFENGEIEADEEHEEEEERRDNGEGRHEEGIRLDDEERGVKEQRAYGGEEKLEEDRRLCLFYFMMSLLHLPLNMTLPQLHPLPPLKFQSLPLMLSLNLPVISKTRLQRQRRPSHWWTVSSLWFRVVVQCSDKGLEKVPYGIPYNSRYVLLMNNRIDSIQLDLLNEYLSMEFLVLSNNRLTDGSIEGAFEGIPALRRLYLDRNLLESVPTDLPASLEELRLDNNQLNVMSEGAWAHCPGLLVLSLNNNSLGNGNDTLPASVLSPLGSLRTLSLDRNRLASVPLGLPLSIRELYLRGNLIQKFPGEAFMGTSELVILDLSANRLTNHGLLRESLVNATHLESLNLEGNQLKKVPRHLPSSLKTLNLEGNLISSVGKASFLHLPHLEHLGLASNKIARVASGAFRALPVLHQLDLCHNALSQVPRQLPWGLHSVALTHNKIHSVPRDAFCWGGSDLGLSSLVLVQLEHNLIDLGHLDAKAFHCLRGFQVVHFY
ncbi:extracellular matrix protein 2-like [Oncorhynchus tshawytscha]|uniref:extracellular matrix protein 2-like n=1 Tax=Oncorhynchus tshawytscha TaxID=74940 RepID=UPI001C3D027B|nr:extracellular matrix protein 2-like [Oncorhynchus tshawytscha]